MNPTSRLGKTPHSQMRLTVTDCVWPKICVLKLKKNTLDNPAEKAQTSGCKVMPRVVKQNRLANPNPKLVGNGNGRPHSAAPPKPKFKAPKKFCVSSYFPGKNQP